MALRVNHKNARIPGPTKRLVEKMAKDGHDSCMQHLATYLDADFIPWEDTAPIIKDAWILGAKGMYRQMAIAGGAKVEKIPEKKAEGT